MQMQQALTTTAVRCLGIYMRKPCRNFVAIGLRTLQDNIMLCRAGQAYISLPALRTFSFDFCINKFATELCKAMLVYIGRC